MGLLSVLDTMDRNLSWEVFDLSVGLLEWPLSVPAVWFGCPVTAFGLGAYLMGAAGGVAGGIDGAGFRAWLALTGLISAVLLRRWFGLLLRGNPWAMYQTTALLPLMFSAIAIARVLDAVATADRGGRRLLAPVSFYLCSYMFTQTFVLFLKALTRRVRPGVALAGELEKVPRRIPSLTYLRMKGHTAIESFPSGDAAGAAVFSASLVIACGWSVPAAGTFALLSAFGRMYLWAHHLADVSAGAAIAVACCWALDAAAGGHAAFGLVHVGLAIPAFASVYGIVLKLRRPLDGAGAEGPAPGPEQTR